VREAESALITAVEKLKSPWRRWGLFHAQLGRMLLQLQRPLAFFDLETTGVRIGRDRIVQVGVVRVMPDGSRESWESLVNPEMPIPPEATAVHGISDLDVAFAPRLQDVASELLA